jgi:serine/threonine protein kinase
MTTRTIHTFYNVFLNKELGKGSNARVVKGIRLLDNKEVAIKIISRTSLTEKKFNLLVNEIVTLKVLNHDHIVKLYDIFEDTYHFYIVMEIVTGGELFDRIAKKVHYNESEARELCCYILQALQHCHSKHVVHRDLKPENLLMATIHTDVDVKLCDFGFSEVAENDSLKGYLGTPIYMAPEIIHR